jgi:hypothetical protein
MLRKAQALLTHEPLAAGLQSDRNETPLEPFFIHGEERLETAYPLSVRNNLGQAPRGIRMFSCKRLGDEVELLTTSQAKPSDLILSISLGLGKAPEIHETIPIQEN